VGYRLIEVGEGLRRRQEAALRSAQEAGWSIEWLPGLPPSLGPPPSPDPSSGVGQVGAGIVLTNELLDALPVHRLDVRGTELREAWVALQAEGSAPGSRHAASLEEQWAGPSPEALEELTLLFGTADPVVLRPWTLDGRLEVRPRAFEFL
jgi:SAM-dependent MidA family methyltransferase